MVVSICGEFVVFMIVCVKISHFIVKGILMKIFKILLLIITLSVIKLSACAGSFYSTYIKDYYYDFLPPSQEDNPLYDLSTMVQSYDERMQFFRKKSRKLNVAEWALYLKKNLTTDEVDFLFYDSEQTLTKRYKKIAKKADNSAFEKYIRYVEKQQKNVALYRDEVNDKENVLIKQGVEALKVESDSFLKLRYLFLTMRLNHYSGQYRETLALYDTYYPSLKNVNSIVVEWIDALRAGALQHLGEDVASNLLYAKILKNNKTNAYLGYYDFKIKNDTQWKNLLATASTAEQKALFHFLRALKWNGSELKEHHAMAKIAPKSIWFKRLTYMIMQDFQKKLYEYELSSKDKYRKNSHNTYLEEKKYFFKTLSSLENPSFFARYSKLYLDVLEHQQLEPKKLNALKTIANSKEKKFVDMLLYLNKVTTLKSVDKEHQKTLFHDFEKILKNLPTQQASSLFAYTAYHMEKLYPRGSTQKMISKLYSVAPHYYVGSITRNVDAIKAKNFESYVENKNRSIYERKLFKKAMNSLGKSDVAKILAILNIKEGNFKSANKYLKQVPTLNRSTPYNPFNVSLSGNNRKVKGAGYSQKQFVETMLKIGVSIEQNPTSSMDHFLYANGLYNSSWFGNFPMSASLYRNTTYINRDEAKRIEENFEKVTKEYTLALKYAKKENFKAKIAYQLLKVKSNILVLKEIQKEEYFYFSEFKDKQNFLAKPFSTEIASYIKSYGQTKYGRNIINRCATFKNFK